MLSKLVFDEVCVYISIAEKSSEDADLAVGEVSLAGSVTCFLKCGTQFGVAVYPASHAGNCSFWCGRFEIICGNGAACHVCGTRAAEVFVCNLSHVGRFYVVCV